MKKKTVSNYAFFNKFDLCHYAAAHDLMLKLLDPDPAARAKHFDGVMEGVLAHAFFTHGTDITAAIATELKVLNRNISRVERRLGGMERKLEEIRDQLCAQTRMTRELLSKDHDLPTYVVLVPKASAGGGKKEGGGGEKGSRRARAAAAAAAVRRLVVRRSPRCITRAFITRKKKTSN